MSTTTTNLLLKKPETADSALIGDLNDNADTLDVLWTSTTPESVGFGVAAAAGTSDNIARADHEHGGIAAGTPVACAGANAEGDAATFARSNHVHQCSAIAGLATEITDRAAADTALDARVDTLEADVASLETADSALDTRLDALEAFRLRAYATFTMIAANGGVTVHTSGGVTSITDEGTGLVQVNLSTTFADANAYVITLGADSASARFTGRTASGFQIDTSTEPRIVSFLVFGP